LSAFSHIFTLSLHDALPIWRHQDRIIKCEIARFGFDLLVERIDLADFGVRDMGNNVGIKLLECLPESHADWRNARFRIEDDDFRDRKSTRLNSSHVKISYAV